jgi:RNA polymerase sigma-70 factor (ECF subfamily)
MTAPPGQPDDPFGDGGTLDLLRRFQGGEERAWDELYRRHRDELLLSVRSGMGPRLRGAMQSEDVLQSVALEAFRGLKDFDGQRPGGLRGFLNRLVRTKLIDRARALGRRKRSGGVPLGEALAESLAAPDAPVYDDPRYAALERALRELPPDLREVIRLRRFEGLSSKEAAARLDRSDDAVRKLYSRAMARLALLAQREQP